MLPGVHGITMQMKYNKNVNVKKALSYYIIKIVILLLIIILHRILFQIQFKMPFLSKPVQKGNLHNSSFLSNNEAVY